MLVLKSKINMYFVFKQQSIFYKKQQLNFVLITFSSIIAIQFQLKQ